MELSDRFSDALAYANRLHREQKRKGTEIPYLAHLLAVASLALEAGADEDEAIGALLHDAVEDQGGQPTLAEIRTRFGERVAGIVEGCTDADVIPKPPWRERKERHLEHLKTAAPSVRLVACCDKLHNARAIVAELRVHGVATWERFKGGRDGTLWYYRAFLGLWGEAEKTPLHAELSRVVAEMDALADGPVARADSTSKEIVL